MLSASPIAMISGPTEIQAGQQATFSAAGSHDPDPGAGSMLSFSWDLDGDGNFWDGYGEQITFDPAQYGSLQYGTPRNVSVRVSDGQDPDSVATQALTVNAPAPTLSNLRVTDWSGSPTTPWVGDTVTLKADVSSFMGDWLTYSIAWATARPTPPARSAPSPSCPSNMPTTRQAFTPPPSH